MSHFRLAITAANAVALLLPSAVAHAAARSPMPLAAGEPSAGGFWATVVSGLIAGALSGTMLSFVAGMVFKRRTEQVAAEVKNQFEQALLRYRSSRAWREQSLADLLGPVSMQLDRSESAFKQWKGRNEFIETKIIKECNQTIRDLLLSKGHLIPQDLLPDANKLIEHYDRWLEEFERLRGTTAAGVNTSLPPAAGSEAPFVFVGPKGFPFPRKSADQFQGRFKAVWKELYGERQDSTEGSRVEAVELTPD